MRRLNKLLIAFLLICSVSLTVPSCSVVREQAAQGVENLVRDKVADQLPADKQAAFKTQWATDRKGALLTAAEVLGVEKLADIIEEQDQAIATALRDGGKPWLEENWMTVAVAFAAAILQGWQQRSKSRLATIATTLVGGMQRFMKESTVGNKDLMSAVKREALLKGTKVDIDKMVGQVLTAKNEEPIKVD